MPLARSRADKVAEAQRLRAEGLPWHEIAERLGVARSTAHMLATDPDLASLRARKDSYRGVCRECGGPTDGSAGPGKAPTRCIDCIRWTPKEIIAAIQAWADEHGGIPPRQADWVASEGWPNGEAVGRRFGWNNMLLKAGFSLRCDRRPETQDWIEEQVRVGVPTQEIADALGVTPSNIHNRLRTRGKRLSDLPA